MFQPRTGLFRFKRPGLQRDVVGVGLYFRMLVQVEIRFRARTHVHVFVFVRDFGETLGT